MSEQSGFERMEGKLDSLTLLFQSSQVDAAGRLATLDSQMSENKRRIDDVEAELDDFKTTMGEAVKHLATKEDVEKLRETIRWVIGTVVTLFGLVAVPLIVVWWSTHK